MKQDIEKIIEIPEGVEVNINGTSVNVKGKEGENNRKFNIRKIGFEKQDTLYPKGHEKGTSGKLRIFSNKASKNEKKVMNTIAAHIQNMVDGVQEKFEYKLKIASSHFPMSVDIKGNEATVKNFLGEKIPRKVKLLEGVDIEINKNDITIKSVNRELGGQAAANFEKATRIPLKDRRVFQDGIFITHKPGREF